MPDRYTPVRCIDQITPVARSKGRPLILDRSKFLGQTLHRDEMSAPLVKWHSLRSLTKPCRNVQEVSAQVSLSSAYVGGASHKRVPSGVQGLREIDRPIDLYISSVDAGKFRTPYSLDEETPPGHTYTSIPIITGSDCASV